VGRLCNRVHYLQTKTRDYYFWRTHAGLELDLLILKNGKRLGFEIKFAEVPKATRSMHQIISDLNLDTFYIVYQGKHRVQLDEKIYAMPVKEINNIQIEGYCKLPFQCFCSAHNFKNFASN
jgi:predicted AAA+ superfamily ATPase